MTAHFAASDLPFSASPLAVDRALLSGTLAASMERVVRLTVKTLGATAATLVMLGNDRRSFRAGSVVREWMSHDSGGLVRTGLMTRAIEAGGVLAIADTQSASVEGALRDALRELELPSLALAVLTRPDGTVLGALLAISDDVRAWTAEDTQALGELASLASTELQLRHSLAERELQERKFRHDSMHDSLTGLPNRTMFMKRLSDATMRARRDRDNLFAVLFLDLDDFKLVNDRIGHHAGDAVLVHVSRRLEECVRGGDIVARLGGDEFAILLERVVDARDTALVAERVQKALREPMVLEGGEWVATASMGVVLSSSPLADRPEDILRHADKAMYRAKRQGRATFEIFDRTMHAEALTRLELETDLRAAVEQGEFVLHFQPIVTLADGRIHGVEALLRWQSERRGLVLPDEFIPVAEDTGLIVPLGRWALREACRQLRAWDREVAGADQLRLSLNLSVREFSQADLVSTVADILEESAIAPARLQLEITESAIMEQKNPALSTISDLRRLGVAIHLDDFGTGYSSLSYLHRLPLDAVKIDRAFTSAITDEERPRHMVQAILSLVEAVGLNVIAEGVTTVEQLALLRKMRCAMAQGFLFSAPLPAAEMTRLLEGAPVW